MTSVSKLVLGTVQFGCQYGINSAGRPDPAAVEAILSDASDAGITTFDTSSAYGNSEEVLGSCASAGRFKAVSKYPKGAGPVEDAVKGSLQRLGRDRLYGYLLHHFDVWKEDRSVWDSFRRLRDSGTTGRIGFSLYSPQELEMLLEYGVDFDLLQFPRNVFDRRFDPYLKELHESGVEIHVRSTFLQGLFFKDRDTLPQKIRPLRPYLEALDEYSRGSGMTIPSIALNYNIHNPYIDGVLIGVDNVAQLRANVSAVSDTFADLDIRVTETDLLNPVNWN